MQNIYCQAHWSKNTGLYCISMYFCTWFNKSLHLSILQPKYLGVEMRGVARLLHSALSLSVVTFRHDFILRVTRKKITHKLYGICSGIEVITFLIQYMN